MSGYLPGMYNDNLKNLLREYAKRKDREKFVEDEIGLRAKELDYPSQLDQEIGL